MVTDTVPSWNPHLLVSPVRLSARTVSVSSCCEAYNLTDRELEVLHLLAMGLETKEIAAELHVSISTVRNHVGNLREKMSARSRLGIVLAAQRLGLI